MRTSGLGPVLALALAAALAACQKQGAAETPGAAVVPLSQRVSGYVGDADRMASFLRCWQRDIGASPTAEPAPAAPAAQADARLPKSARDFLVAKERVRFRSLYEIKTGDAGRFAQTNPLTSFKHFSPQDFAGWKASWGDLNPPDPTYFLYDKRQQGFRGRDLDGMLVVGAEAGGAFYLLIPAYRTQDGETEAMFLHHGGLITRYKSFAHLLVGLYLEERERQAGRDPSLGHLYHFPGRLADTCAREIIDVTA